MSIVFVFLKAFNVIIDTKFDKLIFLLFLGIDINNLFTILRWLRVKNYK
jgi:hypothetical protein